MGGTSLLKGVLQVVVMLFVELLELFDSPHDVFRELRADFIARHLPFGFGYRVISTNPLRFKPSGLPFPRSNTWRRRGDRTELQQR